MVVRGTRWHSFPALMSALALYCSAAVADDCPNSMEMQSQLTAQVVAQLSKALGSDGVELQVDSIGDIPQLRGASLRVLSQDLRSRVAAEVTGQSCDVAAELHTVTLWFKVKALRDIWVYGRNAASGVPVAEASPYREQRDIAQLQIRPAELGEHIEGQWLKEYVRSGRPVLQRQLQREPLVKRDDRVQVVVAGRGFMLSTSGTAIGPGHLGEEVPVMVEGAGTSVLAVVSGEREVHVQR